MEGVGTDFFYISALHAGKGKYSRQDFSLYFSVSLPGTRADPCILREHVQDLQRQELGLVRGLGRAGDYQGE